MARDVGPAHAACDFGGSEGAWEAKGEVPSPRLPHKEHTDSGSREAALRTEPQNHGLRRRPAQWLAGSRCTWGRFLCRGRGPGICRAWKRPHFRFDEENARLRHFRPPPPPGWPCSERSVGRAGERAVLWALPGLKGSSHRNPGTAGASAHPGDGRPGEGTAAALLGPTGVTWWQDGDPIRTWNDGPPVQAHPPGGPRGAQFWRILDRRCFLGAAETAHGAACSWPSAQARGPRRGRGGSQEGASQQPSHRIEDEPQHWLHERGEVTGTPASAPRH